MYKTIILCGLDGCGKSTQAKKLIEYLQKKKIPCEYVWLRFPNKFSLPFAAFVRMLGMSVYPLTIKRKKSGMSTIENHNILIKLWKKILLFDLQFVSYFMIQRPLKQGKLIVIDRFVIDSIVDFAITTGDYKIDSEKIKFFLNLIPPNSRIFYIDISSRISYERNVEEDLTTLEKREKLYKTLSNLLNIDIIDGNKSIEEIHSLILSKTDLK